MKVRLKKTAAIAAILLAVILLAAALGGIPSAKNEKTIKIGVLIYDKNDIFIGTMTDNIQEYAKLYEQKYGVKISLDISYAQNSQRLQNEQAERYVNLGYDVLCVNLVDRTTAAAIIEKANGTPVIFFNREPVKEDVVRAKDIYYVGSNAEDTAVMQGEIINKIMCEKPETIDLNGDGIINYAMLEGEPGHQDAIIRTKYVINTLTEYGYTVQRVCGDIANWSRSQAAVFVSEWLSREDYLNGDDRIELIICNNDSMALGAADAIADLAENPGIGIVGIDGIPEAYSAVADGRMLGTVDCDAAGHAHAIMALALHCAHEDIPLDEDIQIIDGHYVRVPLNSVTAAN